MTTDTIDQAASISPPAPQNHATSKATRLLSAGTYLDPGYRKTVIRELLTQHYRVVAPSFGYDAVPVLAHALAADALRRNRWRAVAIGTAFLLVLTVSGVLNAFLGLLLFCWLLWATNYLRRIATLHTLMTNLKASDPDGGFDGAYPATGRLTDQLIDKIDADQWSTKGTVFYGGYRPFVGAGDSAYSWQNAQLLIGAPEAPDWPKGGMPRQGGPDGVEALEQPEAGSGTVPRKTVIHFSTAKLTDYVARQMRADLRDCAVETEQIRTLTVERRRYATGVRTNDRTAGSGWSVLQAAADPSGAHWRENYGAAREYLCVRIGSWNEELVTSLFVGFDIKGNTLHTEFHSYVLTPIIESFHLVDQLPANLDGRLMVRVAWDMVKSVPGKLVRLGLWPLSLGLSLARYLLARPAKKQGRQWDGLPSLVLTRSDTSEFGLGRYTKAAVNCGALSSVREMAADGECHVYFQESDAEKYTRIVERRLLHIIGTFLEEHNVDLADHQLQQTNILQQHNGDNIEHSGTGDINTGNRNHTQGNNSPINERD